MTSLEDAWGTNHGIATHSNLGAPTGLRGTPALGQMVGVDISGAYTYINQPLTDYRPEPFRKEQVSVDAESIMGKYRDFEALMRKCKDRQKELQDAAKSLDKHRDDLWQYRNSLHNLLFSTGLATQEEFQAILDAKKACRAAEDIVEKKVREGWRKENSKITDELQYAETNLAVLRDYLSLSVKSLIPEGQAKANMCPICYEKEVNRCCVPCGHTVCSGCAAQGGSECMTCRTHLDKTIPLFFSI